MKISPINSKMLPAVAGLMLLGASVVAGCSKNNDASAQPEQATDCRTVRDSLGNIKHIYITDNNRDTRITFDDMGNVYGQYTAIPNAYGSKDFDTYHYQLNGKGSLDAYHTTMVKANDSTQVNSYYDRDGDLIYKDSTVNHVNGGSTTHIVSGNSKLNI